MNEVTPSIYKETGSFRHWCYKVLPLVYDDSLSYYELLCKVVKAIGDVISNVDGVREDMTKLVEAYNELKKYVDTYFDNLDVSAEVDKKLDEMAADGTLADIINDQIFQDMKKELETKIDLSPFNPSATNRHEYLVDTTKAIASYFAAGVGLDSVAGVSTVTPKTAFVYSDGDKGYMGVLGQGETGFVYTDTITVNNVSYPVSYIDCSQFVSLITKCRNYDNSPYSYAFKHIGNVDRVTLRESCLEMGNLDDNSYTFDFFNYIYSARMAYIMNDSGNQLHVVSIKQDANTVTFTDYANYMEDGDLLFIGNPIKYSGKDKRYLGMHHVGIYYKTLDLLNEAAAELGITLKDLDGGAHSEYGYIIHATGTAGSYLNTLRINTLYSYANTLPSDGNRYIYSCKPYANSLNSNKARRAISYMFSEYNSFGFGLRGGNYNYIRSKADDDLGRMLFQQITYNGSQIPAGSDLNTIKDGYYRCSNKKDILNMPDIDSSVFDLITVGTEAGEQTGMQILVTGNQGIAFRKAGVKGVGRKWGDWGVYEVGGVTPTPTPTQRKFACGFIEFSGGLPAQTKTIQNIDYASSDFTNPRVFLTFQCGNDFSYDRYPSISVSIGTKTAKGAEIVAVNANTISLQSFGVFWFAIDED